MLKTGQPSGRGRVVIIAVRPAYEASVGSLCAGTAYLRGAFIGNIGAPLTHYAGQDFNSGGTRDCGAGENSSPAVHVGTRSSCLVYPAQGGASPRFLRPRNSVPCSRKGNQTRGPTEPVHLLIEKLYVENSTPPF